MLNCQCFTTFFPYFSLNTVNMLSQSAVEGCQSVQPVVVFQTFHNTIWVFFKNAIFINSKPILANTVSCKNYFPIHLPLSQNGFFLNKQINRMSNPQTTFQPFLQFIPNRWTPCKNPSLLPVILTSPSASTCQLQIIKFPSLPLVSQMQHKNSILN